MNIGIISNQGLVICLTWFYPVVIQPVSEADNCLMVLSLCRANLLFGRLIPRKGSQNELKEGFNAKESIKGESDVASQQIAVISSYIRRIVFISLFKADEFFLDLVFIFL